MVFISLRSISALSWSSCEIQKSKMADPRWPQLGNPDVITTSFDIIIFRFDLQGNIFGRTNRRTTLIVIASIL